MSARTSFRGHGPPSVKTGPGNPACWPPEAVPRGPRHFPGITGAVLFSQSWRLLGPGDMAKASVSGVSTGAGQIKMAQCQASVCAPPHRREPSHQSLPLQGRFFFPCLA